MKTKKIPEYIMISNHGKRELMEVSKTPKIKVPRGFNILGLINHLEQEHKNGRFQEIIIKECQDKIFMINLDLTTTGAHKL